MQMVGVKELKNKLTHYLKLTKGGDRIIVTDRGSPIAILHSLDHVEEDAGKEERLAALCKREMIRLPAKQGKMRRLKSIQVNGRPASEIIIEERR
jgi:prevent-host-death family protein